MGSVIRRSDSKYFWISYYRNGRKFFESSKTTKVEEARRLLKLREGEIAQGKLPGIVYERIKFDVLAAGLLDDYRNNKRKSLARAERSIKALKKEFGNMRVTQISTDRIQEYIKKRQRDGLSNASINRELAALKKAFHLAQRSFPPKVNGVPYIPMLAEDNVRKGFFERKEFEAVYEALPEYVKPVANFGYKYGWRKGEILGLTWDNVDLDVGVVRLDPGMTKNGEGRTICIDEEDRQEFLRLFAVRNKGCPFVFQRNGKPIREIKFAWQKACEKAGVSGRLFHDLRRTAIRDLVRSGVRESIVMGISGHKTRSVFDRYDIRSLQDYEDAIRKRAAYFQKNQQTKQQNDQKKNQQKELDRYVLGTFGQNDRFEEGTEQCATA